ncbi:MAG TPA: hypothetical protein VNM90_26235 [Haliangium sp.]|nr:hypothetical protein [Haliangium sp.]
MANRPSYKFEEMVRKQTVRTPEDAEHALVTFAARLGIAESGTVREALLDSLRHYVIEVHLNIDWYVRRLERERRMQLLFTAFSVVLLIGIPPLIALLSKIDKDTASTAAVITAMITGILAIHKTLAAWLDKRQLFGHFWRTSAELKEVLYSFEQTWADKAVLDGVAQPEFLLAVQTDIGRARQIVRAERQGFYDIYQSPAFDVFQRLNEALGQGQTLAQQLRSPSLDERAAREQTAVQRKQSAETARRRKLELEAEIQGLLRLVDEQTQALSGADPVARARIEQNIELLHQGVDQARREMVKVDAELVALSKA